MHPHVFDAVTRRAAAVVPRRRSLVWLGAAGATAALAGLSPDAAGTKSKNKKRCDKEKKQCRKAVQQECGDFQDCLDNLLPCCAKCKAGHGVICVLNLL